MLCFKLIVNSFANGFKTSLKMFLAALSHSSQVPPAGSTGAPAVTSIMDTVLPA